MTVLYSNLCYNEGCYKGTALYYYSSTNVSFNSEVLLTKQADNNVFFL